MLKEGFALFYFMLDKRTAYPTIVGLPRSLKAPKGQIVKCDIAQLVVKLLSASEGTKPPDSPRHG